METAKKVKTPTKFTFKTVKPTGRYRSFDNDCHYIKIKKAIVGMIADKSPHTLSFKIIKGDLMEGGNKNCDWKWIRLTPKFESVEEAKAFVNKKFVEINEKFKIYIETV